jgi:hypothetical protein
VKAARIRSVFGALGAAGLALGALTACQTHVGAAAYVGSTRVSESTVASYLTYSSAPFTQTDSSTQQQSLVNPKNEVLTLLVRHQIFSAVFASLPGGQPSASAIATAKAAELTQVGQSLAQVRTSVASHGFDPSYADLELSNDAELTVLLADLKDPGDGSVLIPKVTALHLSISVSPRYGAWIPSQLAVDDSPSVPSFLTLAPSSTVTGSTATTGSG